MARELINKWRDKLKSKMDNIKEELEDLKEKLTPDIDDQQESNEHEEFQSNTDEDLAAQLAEAKDKYIRLFAEFDNYKKRTLKEKLDLMRTAAQDTMVAMLPVLDDFNRAKKASEESEVENFSEGVSLVYQKLNNTLQAKGLEMMVSTGEVFDPEKHEAITEIPAPNEDMVGKVIDTVESGYILKDKIIRYAKVVVGK